jgi:hypothetical protein
MTNRFPDASPDHPTASRWLNQCENDHDLVIYLGDETAATWTQKAIRQADQVLICVHGAPTKELNAAEELAFLTHLQTHRRLVIVHERRNVTAAGTMAAGTKSWLSSRPVSMHHHVSVEDDTDFSRLHRFLTGRAIGFVAGGGRRFRTSACGDIQGLARTRRDVRYCRAEQASARNPIPTLAVKLASSQGPLPRTRQPSSSRPRNLQHLERWMADPDDIADVASFWRQTTAGQ